jgi:hypothetical protein
MNINKLPLPGIIIKKPLKLKLPSDILLGYEIYVDDENVFVKPNPIRKICMGCSYHETYQRPIYGQRSD